MNQYEPLETYYLNLQQLNSPGSLKFVWQAWMPVVNSQPLWTTDVHLDTHYSGSRSCHLTSTQYTFLLPLINKIILLPGFCKPYLP